MLVLSRHRDEVICITVPPSSVPTRVDVTVVDIRSDKARLGVEAPRDVAVHRLEIQREIDREGSRR